MPAFILCRNKSNPAQVHDSEVKETSVIRSNQKSSTSFGCPSSCARKSAHGVSRGDRSLKRSKSYSNSLIIPVREDCCDFLNLMCKRCCEKFKNKDAFLSHRRSKHAVNGLTRGHSSRTIVEMIFTSSIATSVARKPKIENVLKIHNTETITKEFEDYRAMVKAREAKLESMNPRCLVDGNEQLRFNGTTVACGLRVNGFSCLCKRTSCELCQMLRHGFADRKSGNSLGVHSCSTARRALECIEVSEDDVRKAVVICRVIVGQVQVRETEKMAGFGLLGVKTASKCDEMYSYDRRALLPCFVVICKD